MDRPAPGHTRGAKVGWFAAWLLAAPFAVFGTAHAVQVGLGYDSHAYWSAVQHMDQLYEAPALSRDAYLYSPLFAQAIWPLGRLPWPAFGLVWAILEAALFVWLLRPLPPRWFWPALVATVPEVLTGNIYALMAFALVLGVSRGTPWVFLALTKVTPGVVGLVWLVGRRRWVAVGAGLLLGVVLVVISYLAAPQAWQDWVRLLTGGLAGGGTAGVPWFAIALVAVAVALVGFGAATGRAWVLPVAVILVSPTFGPNTLTLLTAVPRLRAADGPVRTRAVAGGRSAG